MTVPDGGTRPTDVNPVGRISAAPTGTAGQKGLTQDFFLRQIQREVAEDQIRARAFDRPQAFQDHFFFINGTRQGGEYEASTLISCSGLMADRLVKMLGLEPGFIICPFRGEYFRLAPEHNQIVNHLIYPIPDPAMPFLGVHLTRMIDGSVTVGPNAVLAFKREGYRKRDFSFSDTLEILGSSGIRRVLQNHLRSGLGEMKNSLCKSGYLRLVQKYCPRLSLSDLQPWPAGVRAQAVSPDGKLIDDFLFVTTPRTIHTCNAPSPAATSAIPIGAHIVSKVQTLLASQSNPGRTLRAARSVDALHAAFNQ